MTDTFNGFQKLESLLTRHQWPASYDCGRQTVCEAGNAEKNIYVHVGSIGVEIIEDINPTLTTPFSTIAKDKDSEIRTSYVDWRRLRIARQLSRAKSEKA